LDDGYTSACRPRSPVLVPTREFASQIHAVLAPLAESVGLSLARIYAGVPQNPQVAALRDRADIVVACPTGRLADLIEQGHCHLGNGASRIALCTTMSAWSRRRRRWSITC
jgi:superfamily II DNA/RNA helicase